MRISDWSSDVCSSDLAKRTADEYAVWLTQLMALQGLKPADITGAIIANVVPAAAYNLATLCTEFFKVAPMVIGDPEVDIGIEVRMDHRENVGADRLVNAHAAHRAHGDRKGGGEGKRGAERVDVG